MNQLKLGKQIFTWCGGKFYLDWILPTNPTSKNPVISLLWFGWKYHFKPRSRLSAAKSWFLLHLIFAIMYALQPISYYSVISNILVNIYPMIVQVYYFHRCSVILQMKKASIS